MKILILLVSVACLSCDRGDNPFNSDKTGVYSIASQKFNNNNVVQLFQGLSSNCNKPYVELTSNGCGEISHLSLSSIDHIPESLKSFQNLDLLKIYKVKSALSTTELPDAKKLYLENTILRDFDLSHMESTKFISFEFTNFLDSIQFNQNSLESISFYSTNLRYIKFLEPESYSHLSDLSFVYCDLITLDSSIYNLPNLKTLSIIGNKKSMYIDRVPISLQKLVISSKDKVSPNVRSTVKEIILGKLEDGRF